MPLTLELAGLSTFAGFCLAVLFAIACGSNATARALVNGYVFVFRGSPLLVQLYLIYYGPGQFELVRKSFLWGFLREPYWCALLSLTLVTSAYGAEIIRGGLESVPKGTVEAARALGLRGWQTQWLVVLPLAVRNSLPAYSNQVVIMVKATSVCSVVTLMEITGIAYRLISETYRVTLIFILAGAIYLAINFSIVVLLRMLERKLNYGGI